jgi:8-oxo-dGTP pyrophosphatase MutT (NUDIX family)
LETALRETREELSVDCDVVAQPLGRLSDVLTPQHIRRPLMSISPFVYYVHQRPSCDPNEEVAKVVWVPLAHFLNDGNRNVMNWVYDDRKVELPCYDYQGHRIWGLSLKMLDELLNLVK